jgi:hypothetical protein
MFCVRCLLSNVGVECTNGMGRREALLIQTIAAGIERIDAGDPVISPDPTINALITSNPHQEIDGTQVVFEQGTPSNSASGDLAATQQVSRCH